MSDAATGTRAGTILPGEALRPALERKRNATVGEMAGTGDKREVVIPAQLREQLRERVEGRQRAARALEKDKKRLGTYDRLILSDRGTELVDKLSHNEGLTANDLAATWALVGDELIQKQGALDSDQVQAEWLTQIHQELNSRLARIDESSMPASLKRLRRILPSASARIRERVADMRGRERTEQRASERPELTSDYIARSEFLDMSPQAAADQVIALHRLKIDLESRLGIPQVNPDIWDHPDYRRGRGYELFDTVKQRQNIILQREHGGRTFAELEVTDAFAAERVRHQAVQEGLMHFSTDLARDLLRSERPNISADKIEEEIKRIGSPLDPESRAGKRAQTALDRVTKQLDRATVRQEQLEGDVTVRDSLAFLEEARDHAHAEFSTLDTDVTALESTLTTEQAALGVATGARNTGEVARLNSVIADLNAQLAGLRPRRSAAQVKEAQAVLAFNNATTELGRLNATGTPPPAGSIGEFEANVDAAEDTLNGTPSGEQGATKKALEGWKPVATSGRYEQVVDTLFTEGHEGEFNHETLSDVGIELNGEMRGAELWRRLILGRSDAQQRLMISDEALGRGIMYIFRQDSGRAFDPPLVLSIAGGGATTTFNTFGELFLEIGARRDVFYAARNADLNSATPVGPSAYDAQRLALRAAEHALLGELLPMLKDATDFQLGDLARFVMNEGLLSAARGDPYLKVRSRFENQQTERRQTAQALIGEEKGAITDITEAEGRRGPSFTWEGELDNVDAGEVFKGFNIDDKTKFNFRITTQFSGAAGGILSTNILTGSREWVRPTVEIEVNEALLHSLPIDVGLLTMPQASAFTQFYDRNGLRLDWAVIAGLPLFRDPRLRTRNGGGWLEVPVPDLARLPADSAPVPFDTLDPIDTYISPNASDSITIALANELVFRRREQDQGAGTGNAQSADERRRIVQGFRGAFVDYPPVMTVTPPIPAMRNNITYNNTGEFFIQGFEQDTAGNFTVAVGEPQTLVGFYNRQLAEYRDETDPVERQRIQDQLQELQRAVGEQIFLTQVNR